MCVCVCVCPHGVMDITGGNGHDHLNSKLGRGFHILLLANNLGKYSHPNIFPPAIGKYFGKLGSFNVNMKTCVGDGNSKFKPVKFRLKLTLFHILLVQKFIYIYMLLVTVVEGDPKAPFSFCFYSYYTKV